PMAASDTFILYFAGHGFALDEKTYLLTTESDPTSARLLRDTAVSLDTLRDYLSAINAGQQIIILDACRNEARNLTRGLMDIPLNRSVSRELEALVSDIPKSAVAGNAGAKARAIISSCWEGQFSYEYPQSGHSWFCHHLLMCL